jgi:hypothetical protein
MKPVDKEAALVGAGVGECYIETRGKRLTFATPPPITSRPKYIENLTGRKYGRITVIGYSHMRKINGKTPFHHYWVVKCVCGNYEHRKGSSIRRTIKKKTGDMCKHCALSERRKEHQKYREGLVDK